MPGRPPFLSSRALHTSSILSASPSNLEPQTVVCRHSRDKSGKIDQGLRYKLEPLRPAVAPPAGESQTLGLEQSETLRG